MTGAWAGTDEAWEGGCGCWKVLGSILLIHASRVAAGMGCPLSRDWCPSFSPFRRATWRGSLRSERRGKTQALARQTRATGTGEGRAVKQKGPQPWTSEITTMVIMKVDASKCWLSPGSQPTAVSCPSVVSFGA